MGYTSFTSAYQLDWCFRDEVSNQWNQINPISINQIFSLPLPAEVWSVTAVFLLVQAWYFVSSYKLNCGAEGGCTYIPLALACLKLDLPQAWIVPEGSWTSCFSICSSQLRLCVQFTKGYGLHLLTWKDAYFYFLIIPHHRNCLCLAFHGYHF